MSKTANDYIRLATFSSVVAVALIAATVSYTHIYRVALEHGQSELDARLLPLSIDGLILATSLTALFASRNRFEIPKLTRGMLILAVMATIGINMLFGITHGLLGAALSAWPAVAFIGGAETALTVVRMAVTGRPVRTPRTRRSEERNWAREQGYDVGERGRLPSEITEAYAQRGHTESPVTDTLSPVTVPATNGHVEVVPGNVPDWLVKT